MTPRQSRSEDDDGGQVAVETFRQQLSCKYPLLDHTTGLWECGCESLCNVARLVFDKFSEAIGNVRFCDVDVIASRHGRRAMPHQARQREAIHAGL